MVTEFVGYQELQNKLDSPIPVYLGTPFYNYTHFQIPEAHGK
jgi:hypothetical protein